MLTNKCSHQKVIGLTNFTYHYLSVGIIFTEAIQDDVSGDADYTEDSTLRAPADHLNSKWIFFYQLSSPTLTRLWLLKDFGGFQLVQHLQCDFWSKFGENNMPIIFKHKEK